jgi:hypothetical protein
MNPKKIKVNHHFFKIVGDGGISAPEIGEGRFIPALIIDVENNIGVAELIKLHKESEPGDVELTWALPSSFFRPKSIFLILDFIRPMKLSFGIEFELEKQYILVDGIISSRGFRLQAGKLGDKVSEFKNDSILIEVPNMDFDAKWNELLNKILIDKYKKKYGAPRRHRQGLVNEHIKSMREIWNFRRNFD